MPRAPGQDEAVSVPCAGALPAEAQGCPSQHKSFSMETHMCKQTHASSALLDTVERFFSSAGLSTHCPFISFLKLFPPASTLGIIKHVHAGRRARLAAGLADRGAVSVPKTCPCCGSLLHTPSAAQGLSHVEKQP